MVRQAGKLSERIWLEVRAVTTSTSSTSIGAPVETWSTYHMTRAEVLTRPGREQFVEARETNMARRTFRIRYNPTTSPLVAAGGTGEYRVRFPESTSPPWDLEDALAEDGRKRTILLTCTRRY